MVYSTEDSYSQRGRTFVRIIRLGIVVELSPSPGSSGDRVDLSSAFEYLGDGDRQ